MSLEPLPHDPWNPRPQVRGELTPEAAAHLALAEAQFDADAVSQVAQKAHARHGMFMQLRSSLGGELARLGAPADPGSKLHRDVAAARTQLDAHMGIVENALATIDAEHAKSLAKVRECEESLTAHRRARCASEHAALVAARHAHADVARIAGECVVAVNAASQAVADAERRFAADDSRESFDAWHAAQRTLEYLQARAENARARCEPLARAMNEASAAYDRAARTFVPPVPRHPSIVGDQDAIRGFQARTLELASMRHAALAGEGDDSTIASAVQRAVSELRRVRVSA